MFFFFPFSVDRDEISAVFESFVCSALISAFRIYKSLKFVEVFVNSLSFIIFVVLMFPCYANAIFIFAVFDSLELSPGELSFALLLPLEFSLGEPSLSAELLV